MKVGDTFPVTVQGIHVTNAVVEAIEPGQVTLLIPGTRAVVGTRTSLVDEAPNESNREVIATGVEVVSGDNNTSDVTVTTESTETTTTVAEGAAGEVNTATAEPGTETGTEVTQ